MNQSDDPQRLEAMTDDLLRARGLARAAPAHSEPFNVDQEIANIGKADHQ